MKLKETKESLRLSWKRFKHFSIGAKLLLIFYLLLFVLEAAIHLFPVYYIINLRLSLLIILWKRLRWI